MTRSVSFISFISATMTEFLLRFSSQRSLALSCACFSNSGFDMFLAS